MHRRKITRMILRGWLAGRSNLFLNSNSKLRPFHYSPVIDGASHSPDVEWKRIDSMGSEIVSIKEGGSYLKVDPSVITKLTAAAMTDINYFFRSHHLRQWKRVCEDPESSENDRFVALELLKNACVSAGKVLPSCQDTGTATVMGYKGTRIISGETGSVDEEAIWKGVHQAYSQNNFRYSQMAPLTMFTEKNTGTNLPAQVDLYVSHGNPMEYEFVFVAKGGGSANKAQLFQKTKALLRDSELEGFLVNAMSALGTAACPPYHLCVVVGGLSAEMTMKYLKLATCKALDNLPTSGDEYGRAFRDLEWEQRLLKKSIEIGTGAQFGGKYLLHDIRVLRLPRHGASLPVAIGVSCSADRQARGKITAEGVFLEQLDYDPAQYLPANIEELSKPSEHVVHIDLDKPMSETVKTLSKHPVRTQLMLTGTLIVARDIAHTRLIDKLEKGTPLPEYVFKHPIYYAGPAKKPDGLSSGSFGPTTAGRMDPYMPLLNKAGASLVTIGKGNRGRKVVDSCKEFGGFYLGSIGGAAAIVASNCIKSVEVLDMPELGMEAVWKIRVENFPAFIVIDDKGNDFYSALSLEDAAMSKSAHDQVGH